MEAARGRIADGDASETKDNEPVLQSAAPPLTLTLHGPA